MKFYFPYDRKGEMSFTILFLIAIISVLLVGGGAVIDSQYDIFGSLVKANPFGNHTTQQLTDLQFITFTPSPSIALTDTPTVTPGGNPTPTPTSTTGSFPTNTPTPTVPSPGTSLICGTNLGLFSDSDFVTNTAAQNSLKQLHVSTIRIPWRKDKDANGVRLLQTVQIAKNLGIVPLVILHIGNDAATLAEDKQMVQQVNGVMGGNKIYYEIGNEADMNGYGTSASYIAVWNFLIPTLKPLAVNAWFGGPVNFQFNPSYVADFVHNGATNPSSKPDFVSWHEYTCGAADIAQYCYDHIATTAGHNWVVHLQNT